MKIDYRYIPVFCFCPFLLIMNSCKEVVKPHTGSTVVTKKKEVPPPPPVASKADLTVSDVSLTKIADSDGSYTHKISINITNNGQSIAKGFECDVKYNCPSGTINSGAANIVQGGYIGPNKSTNYIQLLRIQCNPIPGMLDLKVVVDGNNDVEESNEDNNNLFKKLMVPF